MAIIPTELEELEEKLKYVPPAQKAATVQLYYDVNRVMEYALRILAATHWWLGWKGALMGPPILTTDPSINTACVKLNHVSKRLDYYFNLYFAASLSAGDVAFIIAHECLHIVFGHVKQIKMFHIQYSNIWNIVCDAFINEFLRRTLKWSKGMRKDERQDWTLRYGIYWKDLPKSVRERYPADAGKEGEIDIEYTCLELYKAFIEDLVNKGKDPDMFERAVNNQHKGRVKKRKKQIEKKAEKGEVEGSEKTKHQKVYVEPGDVVLVKSHEQYGIIEKLKRGDKDQEGETDIFFDDTIQQYEWVRLARAIGIAAQEIGKSFQQSKKIVEQYLKLRASGKRPIEWADLAKATGIPKIAELDEIDEMIKKQDAIDAAEIEAEEKELERQATQRRQDAMSGDISHIEDAERDETVPAVQH